MANDKRLRQISAAYDMQAKSFDDFAGTSGSWTEIERPALERSFQHRINAGTAIFESGCGAGRVMKLLRELGADEAKISGCDISPAMVARAKQNFPSADLWVGDASEASFSEGSFDIVASCMSLQYMDRQQLERLLANMHRALRPEGIISMISVHPQRLAELALVSPEIEGPIEVSTPWDTYVPNYFRTVADIRDHFQAQTWRQVEITELGVTEAMRSDPRYSGYTKPLRIQIVATK